jgi:hypothetical protein
MAMSIVATGRRDWAESSAQRRRAPNHPFDA